MKRARKKGLTAPSRRILVWFCALLAALPGCAAQRGTETRSGEVLVFAVSTGATERYPRLEKTEIFALEPAGGQPRQLFSDAGLEILLLPEYPGSGQGRVMAAGGGRIFARGFERKVYSGGWPTFPAAVYELSTDGSNRARKVFDVEGENGSSNFRNLFVSPSGAKLGYINYLGGQPYLLIHDASTGKLLRKTGLSGITLDCFVREIGWMADSHRLFFTLETGDVDMTSDESYARAGSYWMNDDSGAPVRLARDVAAHPQRPGYRPVADTEPVLLGELPGPRYFFGEYQQKAGGGRAPAAAFLYALDAATKARTDYPPFALANPGSFRVSPSGRAAALTETQRHNEATALASQTTALWVLDLESSQTLKAYALSSKPMQLPWMTLIGWLSADRPPVR